MLASPLHLVAMFAVVGATACPAATVSPDRARELVRLHKILPLAAVLERMRPAPEGDIIEVTLESENDRFLYRIKALGRDGRYRVFCAEAGAGAAANC